MKKVCHLSSVLSPDDVRIFHSECRTLVSAGYETNFVVPGERCVVRDGGRFVCMILTAFRVHRLARAPAAQVHHIHDPELLPWALLLKASGASIFYETHEDLPRDIVSKDWIPARRRGLFA